MAGFNPDVGGVPSPNIPDWTNASRGSEADRSGAIWGNLAGDIASGVGNIAKTGVGLYNDINHYNIDTEVKTAFDKANQPFTETLPKDLSNSANTIGALQNAYDQGKLSDTYYTGQLASLSKKLRAQYPQYEDYVDNTIQQITGIRPANAYRNAIMNEFDKQANARSDTAKSWDSYVKQNQEYISKLLPDYFQNPDKYDHQFIQSVVANDQSKELTVKQRTAEDSLLITEKKMTADRATESVSTSLSQTVSGYMTGLGNGMSTSGNDIFKQITDLSKNGGTPEQQQAAMTQLGQMKLSLSQQLTQQMYSPLDPSNPNSSYASILGGDEVKKQIDNAMAPVQQLIDFATDGNWGMFAYYSNLNKLKGDKDLNTVLNSDPSVSILNSFSKINNDLAQGYLDSASANGGTVSNNILTQLVPEMAAKIADGSDTFGAGASRIAASTKSEPEKAAAVNALIDANTKTITSGLADPVQFKNAVNGTYGVQKDGSSIFKLIKPEEYNDLYKTMYSKEITDAIVKTGDTGLIKTYYDSAVDSMSHTPDFFKAAKSLTDTQEWSKYATVEFAPGVNQFYLKIDQSKFTQDFGGGLTGVPGIGTAMQVMKAQEYKTAVDAVSTLNSGISGLSPMLKGLGVTEDKQGVVFQQLVKNLGANLEATKQKGFFDVLGDAVTKGMQDAVNSETGPEAKNKLAMAGSPTAAIDTFDFAFPVTNEPLSGDQSSFKSKVATSESGGSNTASNPSSSALGKYQIINSTWKNLMRLDPSLTADGRTDPVQSEKAMDLLTRTYDNVLTQEGLPITDSNRYMLHFLGATDGPQVLSAPADAPITDYVSQSVINANKSVLSGKTVGQVRAWAAKHMS